MYIGVHLVGWGTVQRAGVGEVIAYTASIGVAGTAVRIADIRWTIDTETAAWLRHLTPEAPS